MTPRLFRKQNSPAGLHYGQKLFPPSELIMSGAGSRPINVTLLSDQQEVYRFETQPPIAKENDQNGQSIQREDREDSLHLGKCRLEYVVFHGNGALVWPAQHAVRIQAPLRKSQSGVKRFACRSLLPANLCLAQGLAASHRFAQHGTDASIQVA